MATVCVSASGKVLLTGGYLVLDPSYTGAVVSTSSRFYSVIETGDMPYTIEVRSPQFEDATWHYGLTFSQKPLSITVESLDPGPANKFVHVALQQLFSLKLELFGLDMIPQYLHDGMIITIIGDNDFYSQRSKLEELNLPPTLESLKKIPKFSPCGTTLSKVHKTGLGSSAALITSLVSALLIRLEIVPWDKLAPVPDAAGVPSNTLAHNISQFVHCLAQGKIGSGFDVASAIYGSHLYARFHPSVLEPLMSNPMPTEDKPFTPIFSPENRDWNHRIIPFHLPAGFRIMLADVDAGSDTPSLVGKVLKWRAENQYKSLGLWTELKGVIARFHKAIITLGERASEPNYATTLAQCATLSADQWSTHIIDASIGDLLLEVRYLNQVIRQKMRFMGELSSVPIEPPEQTRLLEACLAQPGVLIGGVPGAGGYDAIWLLVIDPVQVTNGSKTPIERVQEIWQGWKELNVSPLAATEDRQSGIRVDDINLVPGLLEAMHR